MRAETRHYLSSVGVDAAAIDEVVLAVGEALSNAIEHSGASSADPVEVTIECSDEELMVEIADRGRWRNRPPRPDGGRGLAIMRAVMDDVDIDTDRTGTRIHLRKRPRHRARVPRRVDADV